METDIYKTFARFRVLTMMSIKTKRHPSLVFKDIDKEMVRICNSINKSRTLGPIKTIAPGEIYRPYRYFDITHTDINNSLGMKQVDLGHRASLNVVIARNDFKIEINDENWTKFWIWATQWNVTRPSTLEECEDISFYTRWW